MVRVINEYKESNVYNLSDLEIGEFFEYNEVLFMVLPGKRTQHSTVSCWRFDQGNSFHLSQKILVYKCPGIEIEYFLEPKNIKGESND